MATVILCDICLSEIADIRDHHYFTMQARLDDKFTMRKMDLCGACKGDVRKAVEKLQEPKLAEPDHVI